MDRRQIASPVLPGRRFGVLRKGNPVHPDKGKSFSRIDGPPVRSFISLIEQEEGRFPREEVTLTGFRRGEDSCEREWAGLKSHLLRGRRECEKGRGRGEHLTFIRGSGCTQEILFRFSSPVKGDSKAVKSPRGGAYRTPESTSGSRFSWENGLPKAHPTFHSRALYFAKLLSADIEEEFALIISEGAGRNRTDTEKDAHHREHRWANCCDFPHNLKDCFRSQVNNS